MNFIKDNKGLIAIIAVAVLVLALVPSTLVSAYSVISMVVALSSIAFYALGALWFWRELNKKDKPEN